MIAKAKFLVNDEEVDQAERLGIEYPDLIHHFDTFMFNINDVVGVSKSSCDNIIIHLKWSESAWCLEWNDNIWKALMNKFK